MRTRFSLMKTRLHWLGASLFLLSYSLTGSVPLLKPPLSSDYITLLQRPQGWWRRRGNIRRGSCVPMQTGATCLRNLTRATERENIAGGGAKKKNDWGRAAESRKVQGGRGVDLLTNHSLCRSPLLWSPSIAPGLQ